VICGGVYSLKGQRSVPLNYACRAQTKWLVTEAGSLNSVKCSQGNLYGDSISRSKVKVKVARPHKVQNSYASNN